MLCCAKSPQLCPTLCNSMDYNPPGSFVHGILQARILEWVAMPSSRGSFWPRDQTCLSHVSCIGRWTLPPAPLQFSCSVVSNSLRPHEPQHTRPPCPAPTPGVHSNSRPLSQWGHPTISSSVVPFSSRPQSFPASGALFKRVSSSHQVAKVLEFQLQHQSFQWTPRTDLLQNGLVGSPCSPTDSQESSPTPQFKSINSLALSFVYSPTLTSIHDHWNNHSLD